jgi:SAM-dependent methyltransferase
MKKWFQSWFDSPYYHILYKDRNDAEAELFIDNLLNFIHLANGNAVLDIACGKGRHSRYFASKGFVVTGLDLAEKSIDYCRQFENKNLEFYVHDMREIFRTNCYDLAVNLFTSFGYFENDHDNFLALRSAALALKPEGYFVLDFFNPQRVMLEATHDFQKTVDGILFSIEKKVENNNIVKSISFSDKGNDFSFKESVQLITEEKFRAHFQHAGLSVLHTFGDYALHDYDKNKSERLIFVTKKTTS